MKKILTILLLLSLPVFSQSLNKVYILSEGGFSAGTSMLSMIEMPGNNFTQSIFSPGNIGLTPDGLVYYENNLYLTEQGNYGGAGKIYKLDTLGTVIASQEVGTNPYSLAISNGKIYMTNGPANTVSVVNAEDFSSVTEINVGVYPQEILAYENYVFVANTRFGSDVDSTVMVINSATDEIIDTIVVDPDPASLAITNDNFLLIGCSVYGSGGEAIFKVNLNTFAKVDTFTVADYGFGKDIFVDKNSDKIYYIGSTGNIVSFDLESGETALEVSDDNLVTVYGYGYDYINQTHYVLDAKDYASNGSLTTYNSEGTLLNTYETSICPRRVLFKYSGDVTDVEEISELPQEFVLEQNYPNPFNPTTKIRFNVGDANFASQTNVLLKVYDVLGKEVTTLVNEQKAAGTYEVEFDASALSTGVYLYILRAGDFVSTRKMLLLR
ncbi:MAG: T9SS type A sorting domain-containing protein [Ignavibacteria bacterium]|jgi:YVTN family beta-propeller protein